jgi:hypothetical protein
MEVYYNHLLTREGNIFRLYNLTTPLEIYLNLQDVRYGIFECFKLPFVSLYANVLGSSKNPSRYVVSVYRSRKVVVELCFPTGS